MHAAEIEERKIFAERSRFNIFCRDLHDMVSQEVK